LQDWNPRSGGGGGTAAVIRSLNRANAAAGDPTGMLADARYRVGKKHRMEGRREHIKNFGLSKAVPKIFRRKNEGMAGDESAPWCPDLMWDGIFGPTCLIRLGVHYSFIEGLMCDHGSWRMQQLCRWTGTTDDFWRQAAAEAARVDWQSPITHQDYKAWCFLVGCKPEYLTANPFAVRPPPGPATPGLFDALALERGIDLTAAYG